MAKSKKSRSKRVRKKSSKGKKGSSSLVKLNAASKQSPKGPKAKRPGKKSKKRGQPELVGTASLASHLPEANISSSSAYEADLPQEPALARGRSRNFWLTILLISAVATVLVFDGKISSINPVIPSSVSSDTSDAPDPPTFWQSHSESSSKSDYGDEEEVQIEAQDFGSEGTEAPVQSFASEETIYESYPFNKGDRLQYDPLATFKGSNVESKTDRAKATTTIIKTPPPKPFRVVIRLTEDDKFSEALAWRGISPEVIKAIVDVIDPVFSVGKIKSDTQLELLLDKQRDSYGADIVFPVQIAFEVSKRVKIVVDADAEAHFTAKIYTDGVKDVRQQDEKSFYRVLFIEGMRIKGAANFLEIPESVTDDLRTLISIDLSLEDDLIEDGQASFLYGPSLFNPSSSVKKLYYVETLRDGHINRYYSFSPELNDDRKFFSTDGIAIFENSLRIPPGNGRVISSFGDDIKVDGSTSVVNMGVNLAAGAGSKILATAPGKISEIGHDAVFGSYLILDHGGGYQSYYGKLDPLEGGLEVGQNLNRGATVGFVAAEDKFSQPYFHFRLYLNGQPIDPIEHRSFSPKRLTGNDLTNFRIEQGKIANLFKAALQR